MTASTIRNPGRRTCKVNMLARVTMAAVLVMAAGVCGAHVVLAEPQAAPGTRYVGHFKVGHGCSGSPTVALSVTMPAGVTAVAPENLKGWQVSTVRDKGRITTVTWKGGIVPSEQSAVFTIAMMLPAREVTLTFPAIQTCQAGEARWTEVGVVNSKRAAPLLRVAAQAGALPLVVSDGWFRALPPPAPSGGYFTLRNAGGKPATLTGAESPACGMLTIHKSGNQSGMSSMMDVTTVNVPPGGEVRFAPGSYHLMCMDAKPVLKSGAHVPVTLHFGDAAPVTTQFAVRSAAGE